MSRLLSDAPCAARGVGRTPRGQRCSAGIALRNGISGSGEVPCTGEPSLRRTSAALLAAVVVAPVAPHARAPPGEESAPAGSSGIGDPYWPLDGNGGIDVASYRIKNRYDLAPSASRAGPSSS